MKRETAETTANRLIDHLGPLRGRCVIAGSIRRRERFVHDAEILCRPNLVPESPDRLTQGSLFGDKPQQKLVPESNSVIQQLVDRPDFPLDYKRNPVTGNPAKNGDRYKSLLFEDLQIDLFVNFPPSTWGALMVIRTGPWDFAKLLLTKVSRGGALPDHFKQENGAIYAWSERTYDRLAGWVKLQTETELEYFEALGLPYWEPWDRCPRRLEGFLKERNRTDARALTQAR